MSGEGEEVGIELSSMISQLRLELAAAMGEGEGKALRFVPESVELELKLSVSRAGKGNAGIKFWVVDAGGEVSRERMREHTIKLKLVPYDVSEGTAKPVVISAQQSKARK
jgi:hypothetical protein